jgi:DNA-binding MarR family transcriptional regulator
MVTNGNITGLVDRLVEEGLISRELVPKDRRAMIVRLTDRGRAMFARMAAEHESWLQRLFADVRRRELARLTDALEELKTSVQANSSADSK